MRSAFIALAVSLGRSLVRGVLLCAAMSVPAAARTAFAAEPWPAAPRATAVDLGAALAGGEPSGTAWHEGLQRLFVVDDRGRVVSMDTDGGQAVAFGGLPTDIEAVACIADDLQSVYVGRENPPAVLRLDLSTQAISGEWPLAQMVVGAADRRLEGLTFLPDAYAQAITSFDDGQPYNAGAGSAYHTGGLFLAGHQGNGRIYVFDIDLQTQLSATFVNYYGPVSDAGTTLTDLSGLDFHAASARLYVLWDNPIDGSETGRVAALDPFASFAAERIWRTATDSVAEEGISLLDGGSGSGLSRIVIAEDDAAEHSVLRYDDFALSGATTTTSLIAMTTTTIPSAACGDPSEDGRITATDALMVLRGAVGTLVCLACRCDVDASGAVTAVDALMTLGVSVGQSLPLDCPPCGSGQVRQESPVFPWTRTAAAF